MPILLMARSLMALSIMTRLLMAKQMLAKTVKMCFALQWTNTTAPCASQLAGARACIWHGRARCKGVANQLARPNDAPG
eukprot:11179991-Lingulodinium_polyedra.AAC.1